MDVHDSSLDLEGNQPLHRVSTGSWKAAFFIIAMEFSERISFFGISTNLITYMTEEMHQDLKKATTSVNTWSGVTTVTPLLVGFIADAYTGGYTMILCSATLYILGLSLLIMSQFIPSLKPCKTCEQVNKGHEVVFYIAIYFVAVATGGYKPCLQSFGADQFDEDNTKERKQKISFFNWWNVCTCSGILFGDTLIVYLQDDVSWGVAFLVLAIAVTVSACVFLLGRPFYRYKSAQGSPLGPMLKVIVVAFAKRKLACPSDPSLLYEGSISRDKRHLSHTNRFRFLDKAAIIEDEGANTMEQTSSWRLATVTQVEELKLILSMIPIWLSCFAYGIGMAQGTLFIKQGSVMNRRVSKHFEIPAATLYIMNAIGMITMIVIYDKILMPYLRRVTGNERGVPILVRMGIGMIILIIGIIVAAFVETRRLRSAKNGHILSAFWLAPQFLLVGIGDGFTLVGMQEFFYEQVPDSMRSLGLALYLSVVGVGSFLSTALIMIVDSISGRNGGKKWIGKNLNDSRLDYFYWFLTVIFAVNMCVFSYLARNFKYKNVKRSTSGADM